MLIHTTIYFNTTLIPRQYFIQDFFVRCNRDPFIHLHQIQIDERNR